MRRGTDAGARHHRASHAFSLALVLVVSSLALGSALADDVSPLGGLPQPRWDAASVSTGETVYLFGGGKETTERDVAATRDIVEVEPDTGASRTLDEKLPIYTKDPTAVWDDRELPAIGCPEGCAYVFSTSRVVRFDPSSETATLLEISVPLEPWRASSVWTGERALIFGGVEGSSGILDSIISVDPVAGTAEVLDARLPSPRFWTAAEWTGEAALVVGGWDGESLDEIVSFDPSTGTVAVESTRLLAPMDSMATVWDGHNVFILGGDGEVLGGFSIIQRYNPETGEITKMRERLHHQRWAATAAWTGDKALILGGTEVVDGGGHDSASIDAYSLAPGPARNVEASPGIVNGDLAVEVSWSPPAEDTYSVLTDHRVYRENVVTGERVLVAGVDASTTQLVDRPPTPGVYTYHVSGVNDGRDEGPVGSSDPTVGLSAGLPPGMPGVG